MLASLESTEEDFPYYSSDDEDFLDDSDDDFWNNIPSSSTHLHAEPTSSKVYTLAGGDRIMFKKSGQTVRDVIEMIVAYSLKFGDSIEARNMLIEMFKICAGPEFENVNFSNYKLAQVFDPPSDKTTFHFIVTNVRKWSCTLLQKRILKVRY